LVKSRSPVREEVSIGLIKSISKSILVIGREAISLKNNDWFTVISFFFFLLVAPPLVVINITHLPAVPYKVVAAVTFKNVYISNVVWI
jgi:hypothetical protein